MIELVRTDSGNQDFAELVSLLDADLHVRDGDDHSFFAQFNKISAIKHVVVAYYDLLPVGCGAIKAFAGDTVEVKRMFVLPEFRGQGIAGKVLTELEQWADELGFQSLILETGKAQPEAIRLYTKSGFQVIPNFGQYENIESSVCMKKAIGRQTVKEL
ncbi:GNAT family N-acetyltransferase [Rufibacter latericius]|uniref:GNAT family N-acetyltransferase n=1 Tax=Rufibacter latericius TaxID=2487040 RepID=A0A3M9MEU0_9BACT|nr:GNAT family N-acetyltransferase [Rufibacter latericius]RNI23715.1 GNAT family N-acetyltransferase [Rufibacter latericius]